MKNIFFNFKNTILNFSFWIILFTLIINNVHVCFSQTNRTTSCTGTPCYFNQVNKQIDNNSILAMTPFYTGQDCGLNYVRASKKITTRYTTPAGSGVPTTLSISGMPPCFQVVKAYVWIIASTSGTPWLSITNPLGSSLNNIAPAANFTGPSKCWGESGTIVSRWDVTGIISGNGNYNVNITNITNPNWAVDGITLMIIYKNPTATYQGNIILADGNNTYAGGTFNYNLNYPAACAAGSNAQAFIMVSDMQDNTAPSFPATVNNTGTTFPKTFYDLYTANTTVASGQSTGNFNVSDGTDCFTIGMLGIYYQTNGCVVCTPPPTLTVTSTAQPATCSGCNGAGTVTPTGGTAPYSYTWAPAGGNNATATGLCAGNYTVTVKDATGCNAGTVAVTVTVSPSYTASLSSNSITCYGLCNGNASVTLTGGTLPFSFTWSPTGGNSQSATGLCAGIYSVTIKDGTNCYTTLSVNIAQPPQLTIPSVNIASITCNGLSNGSATVNVSGGATPYSYTWTPSVSSNSFATGLAAGTYSIFVKDNNNCTTNTVITISQPPALSLTATQTQSVSCNGGNNGSANASVSGGMPAYSYTWLPSGGNSASATNLTAGIYTINVKDANNCSISNTVQITQPPALSLTATQTQSVSCNGGNNGIATATASGGVGGYSYTWSPSGGNSANATNLTAGIYTVNVTDANNCTITQTVQISQPPALSLSILTQSASCSTPGSATANVSGGVGGYSYTWTPTGGNNNIATGLGAGNYTITISDANNCNITGVANITGAPMVSIASVNTNSVSCNGGSNGSATVNVSGGATPYSYTWAPSVSSNSFATGLAAGTYSIFVKDNNNCTTNTVITISQPPALSLTATQTQSVSCNGGNNGSAAAIPSGGVGGYSYTWSPSGGNAASATNLTAGIYTINVNDVNNCSISNTVQITQPPALSLTASQTQSVSCNGGNNGIATATASGGVGGYSYIWIPSGGNSASANNLSAGIYTITISDANACGPLSATVQINQPPALSITAGGQNASCFGYSNGSATVNVAGGVGGYSYTWTPSGGNSNTATGLIAGVYTISVTDANACPISTIITISQPSSINLITSPNPTICFGNSTNIQATGSGGTAPYSYTWNPNISTNGGPVLVSPTITTQYHASISDANNCSGPSSIITVYVKPPLSASGFTASVCDNNSVMLYPTITSPGNGGPYSYLWNNGASSPSVTITGNSALGSMNSYSVIIDDGCSNPPAIANFSVFIYPNPDISFSADITNGCAPLLTNFTANSNTVSISSYTWIFGNGSSSNSNPAATNYTTPGIFSPTLIAQSQFGCISQTIIPNYIQAYPSPIADFSADTWTVNLYEPTVNFFNLSSGANNYQWNFGDPMSGNLNSSSLSNPSHEYLYAGNFIVTLIVKNQYGCTDYIAKTIYAEPVFHLYIPNVFTPDGNGINDVFQPKGIGIDESDYLMLIFDRWGEKIFESNNFLKGWDGSIKGNDGKVKQDVYVYKIYVKDIKGNKHEFVGHVTCMPYTKE